MTLRSLKLTFPFQEMRIILVICFTLAVSGCSVIGPDSESAERTLPQAIDARRVSLEDARRTVTTPDTVNVEAYVIELAICPENVNCMLPDGIIVAESPDPDAQEDTRRITVNSPRQFTEDRRYLMSVGVSNPPDRNVDENLLDMIGYSLLE
jgi:hypothetical protein